jgi:TolA-binding protein
VATVDLVTQTLRDLKKRVTDLRPQYEEYLQLERMLQALESIGVPLREGRGSRKKKKPAAKPTKRPSTNSGKRAARGSRADEALAVVQGHPEGIEIKAIAEEMGIEPNYLYRVTSKLQKDRKVRKRGKKFIPA